MKNYFIYLLVSGISLGIISCGGGTKKEEEKKPDNALEAIQQMGEQMKSGTDAAQKKMEERRSKGDTLAMKYEDLIKYLPSEISGYTKGEPRGSTVAVMGQSYSNAEVEFSKENGDFVKVEIMDYNQATGLYTSAAMMWSMGYSVDSPEEKAGGVKIDDNIAGWEVFEKKSKDAEITLGVGYRFWIHVKANQQESTDNVKEIAKSMDLKALASM